MTETAAGQKPKPWNIPDPPPAEPAISGLDWQGLQKCIHCGFCIQACPTYRATGVETDSPRGRLALMRAVAEGRLPVDDGFADPMSLCLACRACETACPSGVPYGHLIEQARDLAAKHRPAAWPIRFAARRLLPYPGRLRALDWLGRAAQRLNLLRLLPQPLRELAAALPPIAPPAPYPQPAPGAHKLLFFHGCIQDALLNPQNQAALRVLAAAGLPALTPGGQTCCGALAGHLGDLEHARELARTNIALFETQTGLIVNHAGGCGAHLKEYGHLLQDDPEWAARAQAFSARVRDLAEVVEPAKLPLTTPQSRTVTYQDSCHLAHGQKIRLQPRRLARAVPGAEYREMPAADQCCGSAGIYNLIQSEMSGQVLAEKMANASSVEPQVIITANPGCYMQVCQGVRRHGLAGKVEVLTLAEWLDRSLARRLPPQGG